MTFPEWISVPDFYKKGNIIVQYVGENKEIILCLKEILGEQFTGDNEKANGTDVR